MQVSAPHRLRVSVFAFLLLLQVTNAQADEANGNYPSRPVKIVVPFAPGGSSDTMARIIEHAIEENGLLPQPLVVINRGGAGGTIGSRSVKSAAADGYTVLLLHDAILTAKFAGNAPYGAEAFLPVAATGRSGTIIAVHEDSPVQDLSELLDLIEQRPGSDTFAANLGAPSHFSGLLLEGGREGCRFQFAQSGGGTRRFEHLRGRHVDATTFSIDEYIRFHPDGIRGLAYLGENRHPKLPDVPTAIEQGFPIVHNITQYWWMPLGTPPDRAEVLADALSRAMQTEFVRDKLAGMSVEPLFLTGDALKQHLDKTAVAMSGVNYRAMTPTPNLPLWTALAVALSAAALVVSRIRGSARSGENSAESATAAGWLRVVVCFLLIVLFSGSVIGGWIGIGWGTGLFVMAMGVLLARNNRALLAAALLAAAISGVVFHYVFTELFVIDL